MLKVHVKTRARKHSTYVYLQWTENRKTKRQAVGNATTDELPALLDEAHTQAAEVYARVKRNVQLQPCGEAFVEDVVYDFLNWAKGTAATASTMQQYRRCCKALLDHCERHAIRRVGDISTDTAIQLFRSLDFADNTVRWYYSGWMKLFTWAHERGVIAKHPMKHPDVRRLKPPPVASRRMFDTETAERFISTLQDHHEAQRDYFTVLWETGLRRSECLMLRWCDLELGAKPYLRVAIRPGWKPKNRLGERTIPLMPRSAAILRRRRANVTRLDLTATIWPERFTGQRMLDFFRRHRRRLGMDKPDHNGHRLTIHSFRHGYATRMLGSGAGIGTVAALLGDSVATVQATYINTTHAALFEAVERLESAQNPRSIAKNSVDK